MSRKLKLWSGISAVALMGATTLSGCDQGGPKDQGGQLNAQDTEQGASADVPLAAGEGEGGGSGADPATDDTAYLTNLGLIRGHLFVGMELFRIGALEHARTHMKHPESELYSGIEPAFTARGARGFAEELSALATAVEDDADSETVEAAYQALLGAVQEAERKVQSATLSEPGVRLRAIINLVRTAAEEYAIGVVDGKLVNGHEYQDAYGFTQVAKQIVSGIGARENQQLADDLEKISGYLNELDVAWPNIVPPEEVETDASVLYGAAARIEIVALSY